MAPKITIIVEGDSLADLQVNISSGPASSTKGNGGKGEESEASYPTKGYRVKGEGKSSSASTTRQGSSIAQASTDQALAGEDWEQVNHLTKGDLSRQTIHHVHPVTAQMQQPRIHLPLPLMARSGQFRIPCAGRPVYWNPIGCEMFDARFEPWNM